MIYADTALSVEAGDLFISIEIRPVITSMHHMSVVVTRPAGHDD